MSAEGTSLMPSSWSASILRKPLYLFVATAVISTCRSSRRRMPVCLCGIKAPNASPKIVSKRKSPHELLRRWGWSRAWSGQPLGRVRLLDGPSVKAQVCRLQPELLSSPSALHSRARGGHRELVQGPCFFPSSRG